MAFGGDARIRKRPLAMRCITSSIDWPIQPSSNAGDLPSRVSLPSAVVELDYGGFGGSEIDISVVK